MEERKIVRPVRVLREIEIPKFDLKDAVKYLTVTVNFNADSVGNIIRSKLDKRFTDFAEEYVDAYIYDNKEPPTEIAGAIKNIADDVLSGREPVVRAGDYISIQNYIKGNKK